MLEVILKINGLCVLCCPYCFLVYGLVYGAYFLFTLKI